MVMATAAAMTTFALKEDDAYSDANYDDAGAYDAAVDGGDMWL